MTDWNAEYNKASELAVKYETAKKYGSTVPGNRKRENQMILVPRGEAVELARLCALRIHTSHVHLENYVALWAYIRDVAKVTPGHLTCETCGNNYIPLPESGDCPFCRINWMNRQKVSGENSDE